MKKTLSGGMLTLLLSLSEKSYSCTSCNRSLQEAIFNEEFLSTLTSILFPFLLVGIMIGGIYHRMK